MAGPTGTRRVMLLFTVLAGLFLMHGLNAPAMHGMPMSMAAPMAPTTPMAAPIATPMAVSTSMAPQADVPTREHVPAAESTPAPHSDPMQAGMGCVPLRPEGLSGLFLALFLIVITPWRLGLSFPARLIASYRPHGPPRSGVQILRALSISRT